MLFAENNGHSGPAKPCLAERKRCQRVWLEGRAIRAQPSTALAERANRLALGLSRRMPHPRAPCRRTRRPACARSNGRASLRTQCEQAKCPGKALARPNTGLAECQTRTNCVGSVLILYGQKCPSQNRPWAFLMLFGQVRSCWP